MKPFLIRDVPVRFPTSAEAAAYNQRLAEQVAERCESVEDVGDMAVELAGHLSTQRYLAFSGLLLDEWYAYNIRKICEEVQP